MLGKIVLEEHFAIEETLGDSEKYAIDGTWNDLLKRLLDIQDRRLAEMDENGIEFSILSLNAPAVQAITDRSKAVEVAVKANDLLAEHIHRRPDRFSGLAALPMQDPDSAIRELQRSVVELGLKGALVNGFTHGEKEADLVYYDDLRFRPFWACVEELDVPFYLHPRDPLPEYSQIYEGHPWFVGSVWAFAAETSMHALRLMGCGLFDQYPKLKIILGHLGERIPYDIWRVDNRLRKSPRNIPASRKMSEYLCDNFHLTTSGNFRDSTLRCAISEMGAERIMFSIDYPIEETSVGAQWFDNSDLTDEERQKIGRSNAIDLFNLQLS